MTDPLPPLPAGFTLDAQQGGTPPLPPGFTLDQAQQAPGAPSTPADMAQSFGGGLVKFGAGVAGTPGDAKAGMDRVLPRMIGGPLGLITHAMTPNLPTSQQVLSAVTAPFGGAYQPKTEIGRITEKVGQYSPMAVTGPGGLAAAPARVLAPVAGSEVGRALGQGILKGTGVDPYAETIGAILGGGIQGLSEGYAGERAQTAATRTAPQVKKDASDQYEAIKGTPVTVTPEMQAALKGDVGKAAVREAVKGADANERYGLVDELNSLLNPPKPNTLQPTSADLAEKAALGGRGYGDLSPAEKEAALRAAQTAPEVATPQTISVEAADKLSRAFRDIGRRNMSGPEANTEVASGAYGRRAKVETALDQVPEIKPARATYAQAMKANDVDAAIKRALDNPTTPAGAGGVHQAIKREFGKLLDDEDFMRNVSADEKSALQRVAGGTVASNTMQQVGKFSPLSNHLSAWGELLAAGGHLPAAIAAAGSGIAGRLGGNILAVRNARLASELMRGGKAQPLMGQQAKDAAAIAALLSQMPPKSQ